MVDILDPRQKFSAMPEERVGSLARGAIADPLFIEQLNTRSITSEARRIVENTPGNPLPEERIQRLVTCIRLGNFFLPKVLQDGIGRSEFHIMGEICRLSREVRVKALALGIAKLHLLTHLSPVSSEEAWYPLDLGFECPTIDGERADSTMLVSGRSRQLIRVSTTHDQWVWYMQHNALPQSVGVTTEVIRPPFAIYGQDKSNTDIVASPSPIYYRALTAH